MNNETLAKRIAETTSPPSVIDAVSALIAENERLAGMIAGAKETILDWGGIDGGHHKQWTLDQTLHHLTCDDYDAVIAEYEAGEDGPNTYKWDKGIAP